MTVLGSPNNWREEQSGRDALASPSNSTCWLLSLQESAAEVEGGARGSRGLLLFPPKFSPQLLPFHLYEQLCRLAESIEEQEERDTEQRRGKHDRDEHAVIVEVVLACERCPVLTCKLVEVLRTVYNCNCRDTGKISMM